MSFLPHSFFFVLFFDSLPLFFSKKKCVSYFSPGLGYPDVDSSGVDTSLLLERHWLWPAAYWWGVVTIGRVVALDSTGVVAGWVTLKIGEERGRGRERRRRRVEADREKQRHRMRT